MILCSAVRSQPVEVLVFMFEAPVISPCTSIRSGRSFSALSFLFAVVLSGIKSSICVAYFKNKKFSVMMRAKQQQHEVQLWCRIP
jgi:hypothetical protein